MPDYSLKVLSWNLDFFSIGKFWYGKDALSKQVERTEDKFFRALDRSGVVFEVIKAVNPDIIAITEVVSDKPNPQAGETLSGAPCKRLASGEGVLGLAVFASRLKEITGKQWRMVPPLRNAVSHKAETIGLFYRNRRLAFAGPNIWQKKAGRGVEWLESFEVVGRPGTVQEIATIGGALPAKLAPADKDAWQCPFGTSEFLQLGVNQQQLALLAKFRTLAENQMAPRTVFLREGSGRVSFPGTDDRVPFVADFFRLRNSKATGDRFRLVVVHPQAPTHPYVLGQPIKYTSAPQAIEIVSKLKEVNPAPLDGTDVLIIGDTNCNVSTTDSGEKNKIDAALGHFKDAWTVAFDTAGAPDTMYENWRNQITCANYIRSKMSVDNSFFRPRLPAPASSWVLDLIEPAQLKTQGGKVDLSGSQKFMSQGLAALKTQANGTAELNKWENAGKVRGMNVAASPNQDEIWGVSDHLPLVVEITWNA